MPPESTPIHSELAAAPLLLALDIGTSSVRAALYDARGNYQDKTQARRKRLLTVAPDGSAELDADAAVAEICDAIDETLERARRRNLFNEYSIGAVAVACFWHSLIGIDAGGNAVTPVLSWADTRAVGTAESLAREHGIEFFHARTGARPHASYYPAKILWLRAEQSEIYARVRRWLSLAEYLYLKIFGATATSVSMASGTGLLNFRSCRWDAEVLRALGIDEAMLPTIAPLAQMFQGLQGEYAVRWSALKAARWTLAIGDGAANNLGAGCTNEARVALMVGTSGALRVMRTDELPASLPPGLWCYRADERRALVGGALSDGGGLYGWLHDALALSSHETDVEDALAALVPDAHGLTLLPFWSGERSTGWRADARGAILGLSAHTRPVEILRAALEAIAYRFVLLWRELRPFAAPSTDLIASGGALHLSHVWAQIMADALNESLTMTAVREASSRGAVLLAAEALGLIDNLDAAPPEDGRVYQPDAQRHALYLRGLARHEEFYRRLIADDTARQLMNPAQDNL